MKKTLVVIFLIMIIMSLLFTVSCKKSGTSGSKDEKSVSAPASEEGEFNPDEPAPVPKGTPPY
ncbi:MAG: hypothetical protein OEU95_09035 [Nitrospirota bacterium]|nr:hypothetical protein [Nitrospirota bacterium]